MRVPREVIPLIVWLSEEAKQLAEKMEREKKALQEYVEKDARYGCY